MADQYITVENLIKKCLSGEELTVSRLKAYGNELDGYRQKYSETRGLPGYNNEIAKELIELVGYLRNGLPEQIRDGTIDFLWDGDPKKALRDFITDISQKTLSFKIKLEKPLEALV